MLSKSELIEAAADHMKLYQQTTAVKKEKPRTAHCHQYPKISKFISESLVVYAILEGRLLSEAGPFSSVRLGSKKESDIVAIKEDGTRINIEVKATGKSGYITFGDKDHKADWLVWLSYPESSEDLNTKCTVFLCPKPQEHITWIKKTIDLVDLKKNWVGELMSINLDVKTLLQPTQTEIQNDTSKIYMH